MDQASVKQNEEQLAQLLDQADKKFVGQVGVMALALLTEQMEPEQYRKFLAMCVDDAVEMHRYKMLSGKPGGTAAPAGSSAATPSH